MSSEIKSPEEFFGHKMGADRKLVRWEKIVEYFWHLDKSPCVKVTELGKSTEGNPFLLAVISSPENLKNLKKIREMSYNVAHPQGLSIHASRSAAHRCPPSSVTRSPPAPRTRRYGRAPCSWYSPASTQTAR